MKFVLLLVAVMGLEATAARYYGVGDSIDTGTMNLDTLQAHVDCYLDIGPCDALTESYKRIIPDAVLRACDLCSPSLKRRFAIFLQRLQAELPQKYQAFRQKYDPYGIYFNALENQLHKYLGTFNTPLQFPVHYLIQ